MLVYILKSSVILAVFILFYKLFLEKENMHVFKRFYLLISIIIAIVIPLITFTQYIESSGNIVADDLTQSNLISELIQEPFPYLSTILWSIYAIGFVFFTIKFIYNLSKIIYNINNNPKHRSKNFTNVLLQDLTIPHTFFNYIFLNKFKFESQLIPKEVLLHEETHAKQKHSIDIILIEFLQVMFWFNPLIYYIKHAVKLNHEFLADQAVLNHGINTSNYQNILLKFSLSNGQPQLANAINYSFIKKRFTIMKTQTSKNAIWLRSLVLLPLLAVLIYGFSNKVITQKESIINENILIQVSKDKKILLNGEKLVTIETLSKEIKKIVKGYSPEQTEKVRAIIEASGSVDKGFITDISIEAVKAGITSRSLSLLEKVNQQKATQEQIAEYNTLAKHYNSQAKDKMIVKLKDMKRLNYIYGLMTAKQKKNAEPFPNFPPPPPPVSKAPQIIKGDKLPPPPPIPPNATLEQKKKYKKAIENYKNQQSGYVYKHKTKDGEMVDVVVIPDEADLPPAPTKPNMTTKENKWKVTAVPKGTPITLPEGATYYINGKKASLKQAKELSVDDIIRMEVKKENSKKGEVYITTKQ